MVHKIIEELENSSSKKQKERILQENRDNELLKKLFYMAYSTNILFWCSKLVKSSSYDPNCVSLSDALELLYRVVDREVTGHEARDYLTKLHSSLCDPKDQELLCRVVEKNMKCGVNVTTINKIWPNLIFVPPYLGCVPFSKKAFSNIRYPAIGQIKADGKFCNIVVGHNKVTLFSRAGKVQDFGLLPAVEHSLIKYAANKVLIGEALAVDEQGVIMSRQESNGYLASKNVDPKRVRFFIWDIVEYNEYINRSSTTQYLNRLANAEQVVYKLKYGEGIDTFSMIETRIIDSYDSAIEYFKESLDRGEEGIIVKNKNVGWRDTKSKEQIKLKIEFQCELEIVEIQEGTGKYAGKTGSLLCRSSCGGLSVSVGSGLVDAQREENVFKVGDIITVKSNGVIEKGKNVSLFLPIFIEVRDDKLEADTLKQIRDQQSAYIESIRSLMK